MRSIRSPLSILFAACAASTALAQSTNANLYPIRGEIRDAGVYDLTTGRWIRHGSSQSATAPFNVYDNTCTWTGGASFVALQPCEQLYDEGTIPSELSGGTLTAYDVISIGVAYCTYVPSGQVDIDFTIDDTSFVPEMCATNQPPSGLQSLWTFSSSASGFPLPGSTTAGVQACWNVTFQMTSSQPLISCLSSSATSVNRFHYSVRNNNSASQGGGFVGGPVVAGEPTIPAGSNTFSNPPGVDPITGGPCGTGLGNDDSFWINIDSTSVGGVPSCPGAHAAGTNCYSLGYPGGAYAGTYLRLEIPSVGTIVCDCDYSYTHYCTAKTNSLGCTSTIDHYGCTDLTGSGALLLVTDQLIGNKSAIYFYGKSGTQAVPFQGGYLCVKSPTFRTPPHLTGGHSGQCDGVLSLDIKPILKANHALHSGDLIAVQCWSRDPAAPFSTGLSSAAAFVLFP